MDSEGIAFANEARIACSKALVKLGTGQQEAAIEAISLLCDRAAKIVHQAGMQQEVAAGNYDLAALRVDLHNDELEAGER